MTFRLKSNHAKYTAVWYTPAWVVDKVRNIFGGVIDLDPASDAVGNKTVQATNYYTERDNGLLQPWYGNVWLNYPGGVTKGVSHSTIWFAKAEEEYFYGRAENIIVCVFSMDHLCVCPAMLDYPICYLRNRLVFTDEQGRDSPSHQNALVLVSQNNAIIKQFKQKFKPHGEVRKAVRV